MKFGIWHDFRNPQEWHVPYDRLYRENIEQIELAEELGYESVWVSEHHVTSDERDVQHNSALKKLGIINHMVPHGRLESFTYELARDIAENTPLSVAVMKEQLRMLAGAHPMSPRRFERVQG